MTIASLLEASGYHTYLSGKWHLGSDPHQRPYSRGFKQTHALMESGADNWEHKTYIPIYEDATWTENGEPIRRPSGVYSSSYLVDKMISFIDSELGDGAPFFAYLPFQAVHIPVQAPRNTPHPMTRPTSPDGTRFARLAMKPPWIWVWSRKALPAEK